MNATGLPVPETAIQQLGSSRKPAVTVTIGTYSYRSTVSSRQGGYILPLSPSKAKKCLPRVGIVYCANYDGI